jgi:hypothetical protein
MASRLTTGAHLGSALLRSTTTASVTTPARTSGRPIIAAVLIQWCSA